jgi:hypothetical protein
MAAKKTKKTVKKRSVIGKTAQKGWRPVIDRDPIRALRDACAGYSIELVKAAARLGVTPGHLDLYLNDDMEHRRYRTLRQLKAILKDFR